MEAMGPLEAKERCWKQAMETRKNAGVMSGVILPRLSKHYTGEITNIIHEMFEVSSLLIDCADLVLVFKKRVRLIVNYLEILLPSISRTNRYLWEDMLDQDLLHISTVEYKWDKILLKMKSEVKATLHGRFVAFKCYLTEVVHLIHRPSLLNPPNLNEKMKKILLFLAWQEIPYGARPPDVPRLSKVRIEQKEIHWAQELFPYEKTKIPFAQADPPLLSCCHDIPTSKVADEVPTEAMVLFRMTFNNNRLSVVVYLEHEDSDRARMWCRWRGADKQPKYASQGLHQLRMERDQSSIVLESYNDRKERPETWLQLFFEHWEDMVLFHDAIAGLKQSCPDTVECDPEELMLKKEKVLFKAPFKDVGKEHVLTLYQSRSCGGTRLAASIRSGECKRSPVWTAFLGRSELKKDYIKRKTDRTIVIAKLAPILTFVPDYHEGPLRGKSGYAIKFKQASDADDFVQAWKDLVKTYDPREA